MKIKNQRPERYENLAEYIDMLELKEEPDYIFKQAIGMYHGALLHRLKLLSIQQLKTSISPNKGADEEHYDKKIKNTKVKITLLAYQYPEYLI